MISPTSTPLPKSKRTLQPIRPPRKTSLPRSDDIPDINGKLNKGEFSP